MEKINLLIVDDHQIMRDGIVSTLREREEINKIYEASNAKEAISECRSYADINVVLMDVNMPDMDGIEATSNIKDLFSDIEIIALSMLTDEESIRNMLKAGASSYVLKSAGRSDLLQAIHNIMDGKPFFSHEVTFQVMKGHTNSNIMSVKDDTDDLTQREIEILQLIVGEYTNQEIAVKLYISKRTVDTHRTNLLQKTDSKNTAGLVRYALKNNLA